MMGTVAKYYSWIVRSLRGSLLVHALTDLTGDGGWLMITATASRVPLEQLARRGNCGRKRKQQMVDVVGGELSPVRGSTGSRRQLESMQWE